MIARLCARLRALTPHRRAELPVIDPYEGAQRLAAKHQAVRAELARVRAERLDQGRP